MRKICTAFALAAAVSVSGPVAHAEQQRLDANVGVFKVVHIDHSVIVAYDCPREFL